MRLISQDGLKAIRSSSFIAKAEATCFTIYAGAYDKWVPMGTYADMETAKAIIKELNRKKSHETAQLPLDYKTMLDIGRR